MTLIDYHNLFWEEYRKKSFTPNETLLYFFLLNIWNTTGRKPIFEVKTAMVESILGMNKMTLTRCRESLKKRRLLKVVNGSTKGKYPHYSLLDVTDNVTDNVTIHRVIRVKEKERISKDIPKKDELSLPSTTKTDDSKSDRMDWGAFMQTFNDMLSPAIPRIISVNESRRQRVKSIVKEFGKESIMKVFEIVSKSDFLTGRKTDWKCDFDWIFQKRNYIKILEGNYDNGEQIQRNAASGFTSKQEANNYAFEQFLRDREARENGMAYEVEKPF